MPYHQRTVRSRLKTRQLDQSFERAVAIGGRYGPDSRKFAAALGGFVQLTNSFQITPTFPVPAMILQKHPQVLGAVAGKGKGAELAAHGYAHLDYTSVADFRVEKHIRNAKAVFHRHGYRRIGFRFPYLRRNPGLLAELERQALIWDSSEVVEWDVLDRSEHSTIAWDAYRRIMDTYAPRPASGFNSLPYFIGNLVEIPVSMPDDDVLIDRMKIRKSEVLSAVWGRMLMEAWRRGEMMVFQLHPERYFFFGEALRRLLIKAQGLGNVWTASLGEIAEWWRERNGLKLEFKSISPTCTEIRCPGSGRAGLSINDGRPDRDMEIRSLRPDPNGLPRWSVSGRIKPWVGVSPEIPESDESIRFMIRHGFIFEKSRIRRGFACSVSTEPGSARAAIRHLKRYPERMLRLNPWPGGRRCAFSVTGDIDGLDIWDFWSRFHAR